MKSPARSLLAAATLSTMACFPACRCSSSTEPSGATAAPAASESAAPAPSVSIDTSAVRRINMRPGARPLLINPSAVRLPAHVPTPPPQ